MTRSKNTFFILTVLAGLLFTSCGIPRADLENTLKKSQSEKETLMSRISELEIQLKNIRKQLREKETQFEALFYRYETLSRDYLKLKKSLENNQAEL